MFSKYIILFFIYSVFGWLLENTTQLIEKHKVTNRGFLVGPYCPIYGVGALLLHFLLGRYQNDPIVLFLLSIIICCSLEYITSYVMEKIFNARWWDYSTKKFNINGRICLETGIPFGLFGTISIYFFNPTIFSVMEKVPVGVLIFISFVISFSMLIDFAISFHIISRFESDAFRLREDSSDEISARVKEQLMQMSKSYKRLLKSFPRLKIKK